MDLKVFSQVLPKILILGTPFSTGIDLAAPYDVRIPPGEGVKIDLDIRVGFPPGYSGRIASRSGHAYKHSVCAFSGVIDRVKITELF